ncbi:hypothetical protein BDR06DRAFT_841946, partial [Suillus hirtellus]
QLHMGHVPLNKHIHRISKSLSVRCLQCNAHEETIKHFLLDCPKYVRQYMALREELRCCPIQLQNL